MSAYDDGDRLAESIAAAKAQQLSIRDRMAAGRGRPGDQSRLRILEQIENSFKKRLERSVLPDAIGSQAEDWLRNQSDTDRG